jgi:hypothetical protein
MSLADPTQPFDRVTLDMVQRDHRRWSRTWLCPVVRIVSRVAVAVICAAKRIVPTFAAHSTMDRLCVWFLRRFVSPDAGALLIRHFVVETNLLNFVVRNAGRTAPSEVTLTPTTLADLGNHAVLEHDLNAYRVLLAVRLAGRPDIVDYSMLTVPPIDPERHRRRLLRLDIQTALYAMNIAFALCLTAGEYRRAVHSLRLDGALLTALATITGDPTFHRWRPSDLAAHPVSVVDVPSAVYEHAVICEHAHAWLLHLADGGRPSRG